MPTPAYERLFGSMREEYQHILDALSERSSNMAANGHQKEATFSDTLARWGDELYSWVGKDAPTRQLGERARVIEKALKHLETTNVSDQHTLNTRIKDTVKAIRRIEPHLRPGAFDRLYNQILTGTAPGGGMSALPQARLPTRQRALEVAMSPGAIADRMRLKSQIAAGATGAGLAAVPALAATFGARMGANRDKDQTPDFNEELSKATGGSY